MKSKFAKAERLKYTSMLSFKTEALTSSCLYSLISYSYWISIRHNELIDMPKSLLQPPNLSNSLVTTAISVKLLQSK